MVEEESVYKVKRVRSDIGGEYVSSRIQQFCKDAGIMQEYSTPYTPKENGVAERLNRALMEKVRCMMLSAFASKELWVEALAAAVFLKNVLPCIHLAITP